MRILLEDLTGSKDRPRRRRRVRAFAEACGKRVKDVLLDPVMIARFEGCAAIAVAPKRVLEATPPQTATSASHRGRRWEKRLISDKGHRTGGSDNRGCALPSPASRDMARKGFIAEGRRSVRAAPQQVQSRGRRSKRPASSSCATACSGTEIHGRCMSAETGALAFEIRMAVPFTGAACPYCDLLSQAVGNNRQSGARVMRRP